MLKKNPTRFAGQDLKREKEEKVKGSNAF